MHAVRFASCSPSHGSQTISLPFRVPFTSSAPFGYFLQQDSPEHQKRQQQLPADSDLLPSSWLHQGLDELCARPCRRRFGKKHSQCPCLPFDQLESRKAMILEKYYKNFCQPRAHDVALLRRAISDHQIAFMDPSRDVQEEIFRPKHRNAAAGQKECCRRRSRKCVSFEKRIMAIRESGEENKEEEEEDGIEEGREEGDGSKRPENTLIKLASPPPNRKSILCKKQKTANVNKADGGIFKSNPNAVASQEQLPLCANMSRRKQNGPIATSSSSGGLHDIAAVCPMDYATFRAWRRGSRLSLDVRRGIAGGDLLNAICPPPDLSIGNQQKALCPSPSSSCDSSNCAHGFSVWLQKMKLMLSLCSRKRHQRKPKQQMPQLDEQNTTRMWAG